ncbi:unnamed protein product [Parascedosporium putredinis]|uniref:Uncharacterized protein n=1 Tax=Parascedosporium putredinis TaxID=1442378 RepID=A0A9P1H6K5_9PEZI|nr:unnamed protein product [Parascedosporium putredinis]CAI7998900.1 unnamed protein product [Parascedosporium putredinis]
MPGYIPATDYARPYYSGHLQNNHPDLIKILSHLNCDYFCHPGGRPPTMLALKRHAQALAILIRAHCISTSGGEINAQGSEQGEGLYENTDENHQIPLSSLMNHVKRYSDVAGPEFHCPFESYKPRDPSERPSKVRPYQTHHNLLMHANDCLEILDNEYGATGGFMSILPSGESDEAEEMKAARNSLVGQWLLFTQHLVGRMHELEINYAQSLDLLAGDAAVPLQVVGKTGPSKTTGRDIGFPQDRWVLANAGDDIFDLLHQRMDKEEDLAQETEAIWKAGGVSGERMWKKTQQSQDVSRGIVAIDVQTRYYRLKNAGKSTIFVVPGWEFHPSCSYTRIIEQRPTVVAVPAPQWPPRVSDWEAKARAKLEAAEELARDHNQLRDNMNEQLRAHNAFVSHLKKTTLLAKSYEAAFARDANDQIKRMTEELQQYRDKLTHLAEVLPQSYHHHLEMSP